LAQVRYRGGVGTQLELQDAATRSAQAHEQLVAAETALRTGIVHARFAAGLL
jgi:outer membrane protein TolC